MILDKISRFTPRYGPEWGSGGIFGLRYHKGVLYFNLAFEAKAHFIGEDRHTIYDYHFVGSGPASGGDTYNAVNAIDNFIYFGGWVHAPASYKRDENMLYFYTKYTHLHRYDIYEDKVELLWKEGISDPKYWAGEISEIVFDELNNRLLLARADGHKNLGVYKFDLDEKKMSILSEEPALKGTIFLEYACFNTGQWLMSGVQCFNMATGERKVIEVDLNGKDSIDGGPIIFPVMGNMAVASNKLFVFTRGGVFTGNPIIPEDEPMRFYRLFDFGENSVSPFRVNSLPIGGGLLTAYNGLPDMLGARVRPNIMPTALIYVTPPVIRIVGVFGARLTSLEKYDKYILVAGNTMPNVSEWRTTPLDTGSREIMALSDDILLYQPPPFEAYVRGDMIKDNHWGGIPIYGYREPKIIIKASKDNELFIYEYNLSSTEADVDKFKINKGRNVIDLSCFAGIVSFKFNESDEKLKSAIKLL